MLLSRQQAAFQGLRRSWKTLFSAVVKFITREGLKNFKIFMNDIRNRRDDSFDSELGFHVQVVTNDLGTSGPFVQGEPNCITCHLELVEDSIPELPLLNFDERDHSFVAMDLECRCMFVFLPRKHQTSLTDMAPAELDAFVGHIKEFAQRWNIDGWRMTINHATFRNTDHLHAKMSVSFPEFQNVLRQEFPKRIKT